MKKNAPPTRDLLLGPHAIEEALKAKAPKIQRVYATQSSAKRFIDLLNQVVTSTIEIEYLSQIELDKLTHQKRHQGIVAQCSPFTYTSLDDLLSDPTNPCTLLALDEIQDPQNVGAMIRSAMAFGANGIITLKDRAAPISPTVVRASAGTTARAKVARVTNLARTLSDLKDQYFEIVGLAGEATADLHATAKILGPRRVLVVGSEGKGLRRLVRERCDQIVSIPIDSEVESLNASVAVGIALHILRSSE